MIGHIYRVVNAITDDVYVGSTIQTLKNRFKAHRSNASLDKPGKLYDLMRSVGVEHFRVELLETIEYECISELGNKEREHHERIQPTLNMKIPNMTQQTKIGRIYKISYTEDISFFYIGSSINTIEKRLADHRSASNKGTTPFYTFMREHGRENFTIECLEEDVPTPDLIAREDHWIKVMKPTLNKNTNLMMTSQERDRLKFLKNREKRLEQIHERRRRQQEILKNTVIVSYESSPGFTYEMLIGHQILSLKIIARRFGIRNFAPTKERLIYKILTAQHECFET